MKSWTSGLDQVTICLGFGVLSKAKGLDFGGHKVHPVGTGREKLLCIVGPTAKHLIQKYVQGPMLAELILCVEMTIFGLELDDLLGHFQG